jgi:L-ascorbate metabolism protein UlaG (beta-lactamase superfamily)
VLSELQQPLDLPPGLELQWLGTAGYRLSYQGQSLYIDPYLSRTPLSVLMRRQASLPDPALLQRLLPAQENVAGVLVGHCHWDHVVDAPAIARRHRARIYGSHSLAQLMKVHGAPELAVVVAPHKVYELGPFRVRFVPSLHSKLILGYSVLFDGELSCEHVDELCPSAYKCGQVFGIRIEVAGITLYHHGSANLIDEEIPAGGADVFLAGISGRRFTRNYWARILGKLQPRVVVASHFDDFFRPLQQPMGFSMNVNLSALPEEIGKVSRDFRVVALKPLQGV